MTIKDVIQHPSTANIKLVATGVVIGLLAQHWIDTKGGISAAQQFLSSDAFKATFLLVLGVLSAVQKGMASANPAPIVTLGASNIWPSSVTASLPTVQVTPSQNQPAAMNPSPVLDVESLALKVAEAIVSSKTKDAAVQPLNAISNLNQISSVKI